MSQGQNEVLTGSSPSTRATSKPRARTGAAGQSTEVRNAGCPDAGNASGRGASTAAALVRGTVGRGCRLTSPPGRRSPADPTPAPRPHGRSWRCSGAVGLVPQRTRSASKSSTQAGIVSSSPLYLTVRSRMVTSGRPRGCQPRRGSAQRLTAPTEGGPLRPRIRFAASLRPMALLTSNPSGPLWPFLPSLMSHLAFLR